MNKVSADNLRKVQKFIPLNKHLDVDIFSFFCASFSEFIQSHTECGNRKNSLIELYVHWMFVLYVRWRPPDIRDIISDIKNQRTTH